MSHNASFHAMPLDLEREKRALRKIARERVASMPPESRAQAARRMVEALCGSPLWSAARVVCSFASLPDEPDTAALNDRAVHEGKLLYLPRIAHAGTLRFHGYEAGAALVSDRFGILEPPSTAGELAAAGLAEALIIVPGVAFDARGNRLGRGRGHYDRFLASARHGSTMGWCFSVQIIDAVPVEAQDVAVDYVVSEHGLIAARQ